MLVDSFLSVSKDDGDMSIAGLRQLAKALGVPRPEAIFSETELIRLIQAASHQRPCFRVKLGEFCPQQAACQWSAECQKLIAEWYR
jgi:hypothetical protein